MGYFNQEKKKCVVCRLSLLLKTKSSRILAHPHQFSRLLLLLFNSLSLCFFVKLFFSKFLIFKSIFLRLCIEKYFLNLFLMRVCVCLFVSECVLVVSSGVLRLFCFDLLIEIDFTLPFLCCESE